MKNDISVEIVNICRSIDEKASKIYRSLSETGDDQELSAFWIKMAEEEEEHIEYWNRLLGMTREGLLPQIFDDPVKVRNELKNAEEKTDSLVQTSRLNPSLTNAFLLALRMEFYLLHPAIESLFHFVKLSPGEPTPEDTYDEHISEFIEAMNRFGVSSPELDLLGETLQKLWNDNKLLVEQNSLDPLTGIYNRLGFYKSLHLLSHLAFRNNLTVSIMMIDVDHFKRVNDLHGHTEGNGVLRKIGELLQANTRTSDVVGRFGGEEFIVFLSSLVPEKLTAICEKFRSVVEVETRKNIPVTISIGAVHGVFEKNPDKEIEEMITAADKNLYRAKETGRNRFIVSEFYAGGL